MSDAGNPLAPPGGGPTPNIGTLNRGAPARSDSLAGPRARGPGPNTVPAANTAEGMFAQAHRNFDAANAQYKENMKAYSVLDHVREELDKLMDLGDMVRPEQVIEAAGRLTGHGIGAENLATLLADMPTTGGQGLASWLRMHDITIRQTEAQLAQHTALIQQRLGVAGIRSLAASQIHQEAEQAAQGARAPQAGANMAPRGVGAMIPPASQQPQQGAALQPPAGGGDQEGG